MIIQSNNKDRHKLCLQARNVLGGFKHHHVADKVNLHRLLCYCPHSEPGKVSANISDHKIGCHIRKRLHTGRYTVSTSVMPKKISDGYSLGVVIGGEDCY
jgi:hypothetical protein